MYFSWALCLGPLAVPPSPSPSPEGSPVPTTSETGENGFGSMIQDSGSAACNAANHASQARCKTTYNVALYTYRINAPCEHSRLATSACHGLHPFHSLLLFFCLLVLLSVLVHLYCSCSFLSWLDRPLPGPDRVALLILMLGTIGSPAWIATLHTNYLIQGLAVSIRFIKDISVYAILYK